MSPLRPDLVDCWVFRVVMSARDVPSVDVLLMRRARGRILPGLWQCVSGSLEEDDRIAVGALRELLEETGFGPNEIEAFYDLDLVNQFHEPSYDAIVMAAVFAVRIRNGAQPTLSHEHDEARWVAIDDAHDEVIWPGYRAAIERIRDDLADPERAAWFELTMEGERRSREPAP
jgi:8-oxo-dGTP pyrophosphatase MutT (NUDIX family)